MRSFYINAKKGKKNFKKIFKKMLTKVRKRIMIQLSDGTEDAVTTHKLGLVAATTSITE